MSTLAPPLTNSPEQHFVLDAVSYDQFVAVTDALGERSGLRVSFDGQRLEFMTLSRRHEQWKRLLGRMIEELSFTLGTRLQSGGQMTFRSPLIEQGLEPDECYWIQHADALRGVGEWDATIHPAPDLAVEIDVSRSRVNRREIYARLGVDELWQYDGQRLRAYRRTDEGTYEPLNQSQVFPALTVADLEPFLAAAATADENELRAEFLEWILKNFRKPSQP